MVKKILILLLLIAPLFAQFCAAQDTLPEFSARNIGDNRMIISWKNNFETVKQISIQRSQDSLRGYTTILTVPDPEIPQNGYMDAKVPNSRVFYRLFIVLDGGNFIFSSPRRPIFDTIRRERPPIEVGKVERVQNGDTLKGISGEVKSLPKPELYVPSLHVYTNDDGNVRISVADVEKHRYHLKFYDDKDEFLFEIKQLRESPVLLEKSIFFHSGWFKFELFQDDRLIEKHKFYLGKEF